MDLGGRGFGNQRHTQRDTNGSDDDMLPVTDKMDSNHQQNLHSDKLQTDTRRGNQRNETSQNLISLAVEPVASSSAAASASVRQKSQEILKKSEHPDTSQPQLPQPEPSNTAAQIEGSGENNGNDGPDEETIEAVWSRLSALPPVQPIRLSFFKKVTIASGHILNDLCASLWFSYLLLYFQKVVKFDSTSSSSDSKYAAALMFLGQIVDGISTPLVGYEADREVNCWLCWLCRSKYGRCKSWHLVGSIGVALSFPFIFSQCIGCDEDTSDWAKVIYYAPFITIFQMGWASCQISHLALIPKMHPDELVRTEMLAIRYGFTVLANVTVFLMTWFILGNHKDCQITPNDATNFMKIAFAAVGIGIFFTVLFHAIVREHDDREVMQNVAVLHSRAKLMRRLSVLSGTSALDNLEDALVHNSTSSRQSEPGDIRSNRRLDSTSKSRSGGSTSGGRRTKSLTEVICGSGKSEGENHDPDARLPLLPEEGTDAVPELRSRRYLRSPSPGNDLRVEIASMHNGGGPDEDTNDTLRNSKWSTRNLNIGQDKMTMRNWLALPQFYGVALVYMATRQSVNLAQIYMPLYLQDSLHLACGTVATIPLTMYLSGFIVSTCLKMLNKYLGRQWAYIAGAALIGVGSLMVLYMDWTTSDAGESNKTYMIYVVAVLLGGGASTILVTSLAITADMIGSNVESGAFVYGAMSFCDKLSCGLTILLISNLVPCGDDEDSKKKLPVGDPCLKDENGNVLFYRHVLAYSAGGSALVGVLGILLITLQIHYQCHAQILRVLQAGKERRQK